MIDAQHHVELNGIKYRIAEDAEGEGLVLVGDSLRPPNTQVVQGADGQKFQMRPDILLWTITDWSGGEGQNVFDNAMADRHWRLDGLDPFSLPGKLFLGPTWVETLADGGSSTGLTMALAQAMDGLWAVDTESAGAADVFQWNDSTKKWGAAVANTDGAAGGPAAIGGAAGDAKNLYYIEAATDEVYRYDGSTWTLLNNQTSATGASPMIAFGDYLYIADLVNFKVYEISKVTANTATPETAIVDYSSSESAVINSGLGQLFKGDDRLYFMQVMSDETVVWEITPTTAAGTGFGVDSIRFEGIRGESAWTHNGTLFVVGTDNASVEQNRAIMYWQPGGNYGTLGWVRQERGVTTAAGPAVGGNAGGMLTSAFALAPTDGSISAANARTSLWIVDSVSGGFAMVTSVGNHWSGAAAETIAEDIVEFRGQYFLTVDSGADQEVMKTVQGTYSTLGGRFESPLWDADLAEDKTLTSIQIACEALPANTTLIVKYSLNGAGYTTLGTYSTTGGTGTTYIASTDSAQVVFQSLRVGIDLTTSDDTVTPVLLAVNVRAKAQQKQRRWRAILDLSDDQHGTGQSLSGAQKIAYIKTAGDSGTVLDFKNGYENRLPNTYEQVDVTIDTYQLPLDRAGEGVAIVDLVEVV